MFIPVLFKDTGGYLVQYCMQAAEFLMEPIYRYRLATSTFSRSVNFATSVV